MTHLTTGVIFGARGGGGVKRKKTNDPPTTPLALSHRPAG